MEIKIESKLEFINEKSKEIYQKKEHLLILISPGNSYYTKEKIEQIIQWAVAEKFADIHIYTADGMWFYNFQAFGYSPEKAKAKAQTKQNQLHNKLYPILEKYSISKDKILTLERLQANQTYQKLYKKTETELLKNENFIKLLLEFALEMKHNGTNSKIVEPDFFVKAFAIEIPLFLYTPSILNVFSSCFTYHYHNSIYNYIFLDHKINEPEQGFFTLFIED